MKGAGQPFGRFVLEEELGRGAMGVVYRAADPRLGRTVALKLLTVADAELLLRLQREAQLAARLRHPGIVPVLELGSAEGRPFLVLEYCPGVDLARTLRERGAFPPAEAAALVAELADAVAHAHDQGVLHRDLKPHNVMLVDGRPRLLDFGIARDVTAQGSLTATGTILGTPAYCAPEQLADARAIDGRADIYALGVILYELLSGQRPFSGSSALEVATKVMAGGAPPLRELAPEVPEALAALVARAMALDPEERPRGAARLAFELRQLAAEEPQAPRSRSWRAPLAVVVLALVFAAGWAFAGRPASDIAAAPSSGSGGARPTPVGSSSPAPSPDASPTPAPSSTPSPDASPTPAPSATKAPSGALAQAVDAAARALGEGRGADALRLLHAPALADFEGALGALRARLPDRGERALLANLVAATLPVLPRPSDPLEPTWAAMVDALPEASRAAGERAVRLARDGAPWPEIEAQLARARDSAGSELEVLALFSLRLGLAKGVLRPLGSALDYMKRRWGQDDARWLLGQARTYQLTGQLGEAGRYFEALRGAKVGLRDYGLAARGGSRAECLAALDRLVQRGEPEAVPAYVAALLPPDACEERMRRLDGYLERYGLLYWELVTLRLDAWLRWTRRHPAIEPEMAGGVVEQVLGTFGGIGAPLGVAMAAREDDPPALQQRYAHALFHLLRRVPTHENGRERLGIMARHLGELEVLVHAWAGAGLRPDVLADLRARSRAHAEALERLTPELRALPLLVKASLAGWGRRDDRTTALANAAVATQSPRERRALLRERCDALVRRGELLHLRRIASDLWDSEEDAPWYRNRLGLAALHRGEPTQAQELWRQAAAGRDPQAARLARALLAGLVGRPAEDAEALARQAALDGDWLGLLVLLRLYAEATPDAVWRDPEARARMGARALLVAAALPQDTVVATPHISRLLWRIGHDDQSRAVLGEAQRDGLGREDYELQLETGRMFARSAVPEQRAAGLTILRRLYTQAPDAIRPRLELVGALAPADMAGAAEVIADFALRDLPRLRDTLRGGFPDADWVDRLLVLALSPQAPPPSAPLPRTWDPVLAGLPAPARGPVERALRAARAPAPRWEAEVAPPLEEARRLAGPPSGALELQIARIHAARGRGAPARAALERARAAGLTPAQAVEAELVRARLLMLEGDRRGARAALAAVPAAAPPEARQKAALLLSLYQEGDPDREAWQRIAHHDPDLLPNAPFAIAGRGDEARLDGLIARWGALADELVIAHAQFVAHHLLDPGCRDLARAALDAHLAWLGTPLFHGRMIEQVLELPELVPWCRGLLARGRALAPEHPALLLGAGALQAADGDPAAALATWRRALAGGAAGLRAGLTTSFRRRYPERAAELEAILKAGGERR
ncbi:MAG: protein kinase [Planctomycetota bacterium]